MKIKKNLVAATAAVLAAGMALAGCGSSNGGSGDVQKTADGKVKITMWHGFSEAARCLFRSATPLLVL